MPTAVLANRVRVVTATAGTGTVTLGAKVNNKYATFAEGGITNGQVVTYCIEEGDDWEIGRGTYTSSGTTLSRDTVLSSSIGGTVGTTRLTLAGAAQVFIDAAKEDLDVNDFTEDTAPALVDDFAWVHDASAGLKKKVKLSRIGGLPPGFVSVLFQQAADTDHDVTFLAGKCRDSTDAFDLALAASLTKQIDAAWAVGTNAGGLDTGAVGNNLFYYLWIIKRSDTGVVDALFSLSATAPTMPTNYDQRQRVGWVRTNASANILAFTQDLNDFDRIDYTTGILDYNVTTLSTTRVLQALSVPPSAVAILRALATHASTGIVVIQSPSETNAAPSETAVPLASLISVASVSQAGYFEKRVDASSQIAVRANAAATTLRILTFGAKFKAGIIP